MKRHISVALICENYPPDSGGIAESARRLAFGLSKVIKIHVVRFGKGDFGGSEYYRVSRESPNLFIHEIAPFVNGWTISPSADLRANLLSRISNRLASILVDEKVCIIHGFGLQNAGLVAARLRCLMGLPLIQSLRGNDVGRNAFDGSRRAALSLALRNAERIVTVNQWIAELVTKTFPWTRARVRVVSNGIEPVMFPDNEMKSNLKSSLPLSNEFPVVGFVGTLREKKGPYLIARLVKDFISPNNGKLIIIGNIDLEMFRRIGWSGWNDDSANIRIRRARNRKELLGLISLCDWLVFPSLDDGMANGLIEAMACAKPVVCSPIFSDIVRDGIEGFTASPFDLPSYIELFNALRDNPDLRMSMGQAARKRISEQFSADTERQEWLNLYYEVTR